MNIRVVVRGLAVAACLVPAARAVDYSVAPLKEAPPKDALAANIAGLLADQGVRVTRGAAATYCDIWLAKNLPTMANFQPTSEVLYPFTPGQLIGVARFARKGSDFRDQDIEPGLYTMRYAQQPVDGAHVGTSPTRDFLLLSKVAQDQSAGILEYKSLAKQSAEAAGSSHPALICLQKPAAEAPAEPTIRHDDQHDWWVATVRAEAAGAKPLALAIVVVGLAPEQ